MPGVRLEGKTVVVTGAASGIGLAIARRVADEGAFTICADLNGDGLQAAVSEIAGNGARAEAVVCDVSREEDVNRLMAVAEQHNGPDALVSNAGIQDEQTIEEISPAEWDRVMAVNLRSVYLCAHAAIPLMKRRGGGSIVNMASAVGFWVEPSLAAYSVSKGAIITLTRTVAIDFGRFGIRCNCICPGYVDTGMPQRYFDLQDDPAAAREKAGQMHALKRLGRPEEVAAMALFLCSDESSFCTGQPFIVDGGLSAGAQVPD